MRKNILLVFIFLCLLFTGNILAADVGDPCTNEGEYCGLPEERLVCRNGRCDFSYRTGEDSAGWATESTWFNASQEEYDVALFSNPDSVEGTKHSYWSKDVFQKAYVLDIMGPTEAGLQAALASGIVPPQGAVGYLASGIGTMMSNPVANTGEYIASIGREAGFIRPAYAQGMGWSTLEPVMEVWKAFRNIAYMVFIFVFIIIGFMIMFRSKLGGQALVTIQTALPQIIVTLLLITFSYAIAALMIDLIYLLIFIVIGVFNAVGIIPSGNVNNVKELIFNGNVIDLIKNVLFRGTGSSLVEGPADEFADLITSFVGVSIDGFLNKGASTLISFIFSIAILFILLKLFFMLIKAYMGVVFSIIFGPLILLTNAIPGKNSFMAWIKGLFANVMVFPVTAIMFIIGSALTSSNSFGTDPNLVRADLMQTGGLALPFIGGGMTTGMLTTLIGFGVIMFIPKISEMLQKSMGVEGGIAGAMGAVMEPIGKGWGVASAPMRGVGALAGSFAGGVVSAGGQKAFEGISSNWGKNKDKRDARRGIPVAVEKEIDPGDRKDVDPNSRL